MVSIANSLGYGSGIDIGSLVTQLAAASREPKAARLDTRASAVQTSISAVAQARANLESFATSLASLVAGGTLQSQPSAADTTILEAKAVIGARLTAFSGAVEITQLARGQTLASAFMADAAAPIGQGTLTLTVGATSYPVVIDASNDHLTGLATAINDTSSGVRASVVSDTAGLRLVLRGPTGAPSAFALSGTAPGLSEFTFPGAMTQMQSALDAEFRVDGLSYSRTTNTVDDVVPGVMLTLKKAAPGSQIALGVTRAGGTLKTTLADFVSVFNELKGQIATARSATRGDQAVRTLDRQLSQLVAQPVTSGVPASLSAIGVRTNRDGTIAFDEAAFDAAYTRDPAAVEAIFSPTRDATRTVATDPGIGGALSALKSAATATKGALAGLSTRLGKEVTALAADRSRMEAREAAYKARLDKQFGGVDASVGALKATQSYLDQQIKVWTASR